MLITTHSPMAMQIEQELARLQSPLPALEAPADAGAAQGFSDTFQMALQAVNAQDAESGRRMAEVDSGQSDDLVGAMLASQEASLSFSMLMQVRNKVVGAMDELIKLQL